MSDYGQAGQQEGQVVTRVILVADDNQRYRTGIVRAIARRAEALRVVEASDGAEALDKIRALRPAVVLLDARMPGLDGPSVAKAVRNDPALEDTRVIVMSATDDESTKQAARTAGATAFVDKSTPRAEICAVVLGDLP